MVKRERFKGRSKRVWKSTERTGLRGSKVEGKKYRKKETGRKGRKKVV